MKGRTLLLVAACLALLVLATVTGPSLEGERGAFVLWQLRLPRVLVGAIVGATLALVGAVFQAVFNNPLATPSTVGTTAGATLGALAALALDLSSLLEGWPVVTLAAFAGALTSTLVVASVAASGRARVDDVLLAGIAVTLAASAISTGIQYGADVRALFAAAKWSLGQLPQVGYRGVLVILPFALTCTAVLLALTRGLQAVAVSEELAHAQGVDVKRLRTLALGVGSLGVAACVAWCGPIAFVGLIVPHLLRLVVGSSLRLLLPLSVVAGAAFLVSCDMLARLLFSNRELPVGVVTAALGAPALIVLIARRAR
jgi:iron complex transport system permease protein